MLAVVIVAVRAVVVVVVDMGDGALPPQLSPIPTHFSKSLEAAANATSSCTLKYADQHGAHSFTRVPIA